MSRGTNRPRSVLLVGAALGAAAVAVTAVAQTPSRARRPILHQDLEPSARDGGETTGPLLVGPEPREAQNPAAVAAGERLLPEPPTSQPRTAVEPMFGDHQFAADRITDWKADYHTEQDGTLRYVEVFNPSVVPFKRMTALDSVRDDYTLYSDDRARTDLPIGGVAGEDDEVFWASLAVRFRPGEDVPIPSVSPDMRILSYEVQPATRVVFSRDTADNYYVRSDESGSGGEHRLVFLAAADRSYFAPTLARGFRLADIPADVARPLPPGVAAVAERVLRVLGVSPRVRVNEALDRLVHYFRSFEARPPPPSSGDIYWDLYRAQAGVCRHRSFAFMITANAAGIPARYVANEAHAFVEVWFPGDEWVRIDLGGAALELEVSNVSDKVMHRPPAEDPFPRPPQYDNSYTRRVDDVRGLNPMQAAERITPREGGSDSSGGGGSQASEVDVEDDSQGGLWDPDVGDRGVMTGPGRSLPEIPPEAIAGKTPTAIQVTFVDPEGFRGETITVRGHLVDVDGAPLSGERVDVWLAPAGHGGEDAVLVGHTATRDDGTFEAVVALPATLRLVDHEVFASTPGDGDYQPSVSD